MASAYIFIDTTLIGNPKNKPWIKKRRRPDWIAALYGREALSVSPILIDIERAYQCNRVDVMTTLVNAGRPRLGVSFIETELSLGELREHLCQFTYIRTADGSEMTLRIADCAVLPALALFLTPEQWSSIVMPFVRWRIHGRDGLLVSLPLSTSGPAPIIPLSLRTEQIASLIDAMGPDQLLLNLRRMRAEKISQYTTFRAYECAKQTRQMWLDAGLAEDTDLLLFARDVFDSEGRLLEQPGLREILMQSEPAFRRKDLQRLANLSNRTKK